VRQVVRRAPQLDAWAQQYPEGAGLSDGHPDTARIHHPRLPDHAVELHVRVPATTTDAPSVSKIGASFSSAVSRVKISVSLLGVLWQKTTSPSPSITSRIVLGQLASIAS
jgi:hypothetical protein